MKTWLARVALVAVATGILVYGTAGAADTKVKSTDEIMKRLNSGKGIQKKLLPDAVKAGNWDDVQKLTKEYKALADDLCKNKAEKGPADSWKKLTTEYLDLAGKMDDAAAKKDKEGVLKQHGALGKTCKGCHDVHK